MSSPHPAPRGSVVLTVNANTSIGIAGVPERPTLSECTAETIPFPTTGRHTRPRIALSAHLALAFVCDSVPSLARPLDS